MVIVMAKGISVLVELVFGLQHGDSHILGSRLNGQIPNWLNCHTKGVVSLLRYLKDPCDLGITMGVKGGDTTKCG
jgi:hypothetical protein